MRPYPPVADLVPHAAPALAIDELLHCAGGTAAAAITVTADTMYVRDGAVDSVLALELMAQTVAACLGYEAFCGGEGVRVGMVIACRKLELLRPSFAVGERLLSRVQRIHGSDDVSMFATELTTVDGAPVARASMTLVHASSPPP